MTTICYRDGVLAADSGGTQSGIMETFSEKIHVVVSRDFGLCAFGLCGEDRQILMFKSWLETGEAHNLLFKEEDGGCVAAIVVSEDGVPILFDGEGQMSCGAAPFLAIGSGRAVALGAMENGADAVRAVEIACKYDIYSGGQVNSITVSELGHGG